MKGNVCATRELGVPFDPILEVVSSFKLSVKQASVFEWKVGEGKLLVSTLNLDPSDPAAACLLDCMIEYAQGNEFTPRTAVAPKTLAALLAGRS
jgi:hypothetical protein